ncbi:enoyl-CoA hydratase/isomerase family protein [Nocardioides sp. NPDC000445]|jgi:2-(1,2-epoxy-1,2-dihydrophenyl)acetyl-CoA isomerase|uniref:2-(1,2-epoxy-1,2-dihydrophenyl)acetyl-CoA isomerase n=1 Tax=Nocardioides panzhihuensis TaxID=860243 RepID=A0A7Z0DMA0_9ACTN|nr:enoyl-CoA hydratase/isomerase family protein [Nocardioides panzhihuensis]NYI78250.1 2-(1,2-epoxy-1,2-dihydrophenyl)acetyl-CoA isomerase [Nocardioides panzhihuensis]
MATTVDVVDDGCVRTLVMNGPMSLNSLAESTANALHDQIQMAERDENIHAIVLTGAGEHFSAGGDAEGVLSAHGPSDDDAILRFMRAYQRAARAVWESPLPIIAAVSGVAYGGAFNLAIACDLVVCSRSARFCQVFLRRGLVPDFGGAFILPRIVGMQRAKELILLADEIDAVAAYDLGFVNVVVDTPDQARSHAQGLAHRISAESRLAVSLTKKLLHQSASGSFPSALELEALSQTLVLGSDKARSAFEAFRER